MSEAIIISIVTTIPPTIASISAVIIGIKNAGKLTEIHTLTNSNLTSLTAKLEAAEAKADGLQKLVESIIASKMQSKIEGSK